VPKIKWHFGFPIAIFRSKLEKKTRKFLYGVQIGSQKCRRVDV
jgi:hypothetical protein